MRQVCINCQTSYDDEFRTTICPHQTFAANDGGNAFRHQVKSEGPKSIGNPCAKCGEQLLMGFGLAGGGYGAYECCPTGCDQSFTKWQDNT